MKRHHELPFGAELVAGGVRFRLWAPRAAAVALRLDGLGDLPMAREEGGWFERITDAARTGSRYRFVVDGAMVPDPASRHQPEDVHGPSEVIDPRSYEWQDAAWAGRRWAEIVLYELHVGTFSERGDFAGVASRLDYLAELGVTAIELMPVADFPGRRNWGYDGVLPFAPDAQYGRPDCLKRLVDACHARGLAVFLDVVYNHFGPEGNYLHRYAPGFFTERHQTPWGAAIDFTVPAGAALLYRERALLAGGIPSRRAALRRRARHPRRQPARHPGGDRRDRRGALRGERPVHLVLENDRNEARRLGPGLFTAQWNDDLHHALHVLTTGESDGYYADYADAPIARLGRALAEGFAYQGERSGLSRRRAARRALGAAAADRLRQLSSRTTTRSAITLSARGSPVLADAGGGSRRRRDPSAEPADPVAVHGRGMGRGRSRSPSSAISATSSPRRCARAGGASSRSFPHSAIRPRASASPIPSAEANLLPAPCSIGGAGAAAASRTGSPVLSPPVALRRREIVPRLEGIGGHAGSWQPLGERALQVAWRLGDGVAAGAAGEFCRSGGGAGGEAARPAALRHRRDAGVDACPAAPPPSSWKSRGNDFG